jgi:hypothetical protein
MKLILNYTDSIPVILVEVPHIMILNHEDIHLNPEKQVKYAKDIFDKIDYLAMNTISVYSYSPIFITAILTNFKKNFEKPKIEVYIEEEFFGNDVNQIFKIFAKALKEAQL